MCRELYTSINIHSLCRLMFGGRFEASISLVSTIGRGRPRHEKLLGVLNVKNFSTHGAIMMSMVVICAPGCYV